MGHTISTYNDIRSAREQLAYLLEKFGFIFKVHEGVKIHSIDPMTEEVPEVLNIRDLSENELSTLPQICVIAS
jgi:hypothetical protein